MNISEIFDGKKMDTQEMINYFDHLESIDCEFMHGQWKGLEVITGHPMNGLLDKANWYGKKFIDDETVFPLVLLNPKSSNLFSTDPKWLPLGLDLSLLKSKSKYLVRGLRLLKTDKSKARLRMVEFRGKSSATMIYDEKPINDVFRRIDQNTVLGWMDLKDQAQPYFFTLIREEGSKHLWE
ncbi:DUF4334 domain-containing protein [Acinetobacter junii]|uniref:DUF4334 domain-containing protein n=1 Tax=Acinetobacter junii TaxID=40215 RepID=UPI000B3C3CEC|nr:DUF4334 domain-containing protein [Acinetobacter junii]AWA49507.1 DUF4334 domain-containing protein [Acinetobacter junii]